jgi:hypothetical protein
LKGSLLILQLIELLQKIQAARIRVLAQELPLDVHAANEYRISGSNGDSDRIFVQVARKTS